MIAEQHLPAADVQGAICDLPEEYRGAVVLALVNQMSYIEVAEALGIPIGTVRSRILRGWAGVGSSEALAGRAAEGLTPSPRAGPAW